MNKNQSGFTHLVLALLILLAAVTGFAGWHVYEVQKDNKMPSKISNTPNNSLPKKTISTIKSPTIPVGWVQFKNANFGFSFYYPKEFGVISHKPQSASYPIGINTIYTSDQLKTALFPGLNIGSGITITQHQANDMTINSGKYAPTIKLESGKWIVTDLKGTYPPESQKVGKEYLGYGGKPLSATISGGISIYEFQGCDEGTLCYRLVFLSKSILYELALPEFESGYGDLPKQETKPLMELKNSIIDSFQSI